MPWVVQAEWLDWEDAVKDELATVIKTISQFEPVRLLTPRQKLKAIHEALDDHPDWISIH